MVFDGYEKLNGPLLRSECRRLRAELKASLFNHDQLKATLVETIDELNLLKKTGTLTQLVLEWRSHKTLVASSNLARPNKLR